jgi:hypothetical protein
MLTDSKLPSVFALTHRRESLVLLSVGRRAHILGIQVRLRLFCFVLLFASRFAFPTRLASAHYAAAALPSRGLPLSTPWTSPFSFVALI